MLLNSENPGVVLAAVNVLNSFVRRDPLVGQNATNLDNDIAVLRKLNAFAYGYGANSIVASVIESHPHDEGIFKHARSLHFEIYKDTYSKDRTMPESDSTIMSERRREKSKLGSSSASSHTIHIDDVHATEEPPFELYMRLVDEHNISKSQKHALWTRIRFAHAFASSDQRLLWNRIRLRSIATLAYGSQSIDHLTKFFQHQPEFISELSRIVANDPSAVDSIPRTIMEDCLVALAALSLTKQKITSVISTLLPNHSSIDDAPLMKIINTITPREQNDSELERQFSINERSYTNAVFLLLSSVAATQPGAKALHESGMLTQLMELIPVLRSHNTAPSKYTLQKGLLLVQLLLYNEQSATHTLSSGVFNTSIEITNEQTLLCEDAFSKSVQSQEEEKTSEKSHTTVEDMISIDDYKILCNAFAIIRIALQRRNNTDINIRELIAGELIHIINRLIDHCDKYGEILFSVAAASLTTMLNSEPTAIAQISAKGTLQKLFNLCRRMEHMRPVPDMITPIIPMLRAFSLNETCLAEITKENPMGSIYHLLIDPNISNALTTDHAVTIGRDLNDLFRHQHSLRDKGYEGLVAVMQNLQQKLQNELNVSSNNGETVERNVQLFRCTSNICSTFSKVVTNNVEHSRLFISKKGLETLMAIASLCFMPLDDHHDSILRSENSNCCRAILSLVKTVSINQTSQVFHEVLELLSQHSQQISFFNTDQSPAAFCSKVLQGEEQELIVTDTDIKQIYLISSLIMVLINVYGSTSVSTNAPFMTEWNTCNGKNILHILSKMNSIAKWLISKKDLDSYKEKHASMKAKSDKISSVTSAIHTTMKPDGSSSTTTESTQIQDAHCSRKSRVTMVLRQFISAMHSFHEMLQRAVFQRMTRGMPNVSHSSAIEQTFSLANDIASSVCAPLVDFISKDSSDLLSLELRCSMITLIMSEIHDVLFSDRYKNTNTIILKEMVKEKFVDHIFDIFKDLSTEIMSHIQETTDQPQEQNHTPTPFMTSSDSNSGGSDENIGEKKNEKETLSPFGRALIAFGSFFQKLISVSYVSSSPLTASMISNKKKEFSIDINKLLSQLHGQYASVVCSIWKHPAFVFCPTPFHIIFINTVAHIIKGFDNVSSILDTRATDGQLNYREIRRRVAASNEVDPDALAQIRTMGFSERRARRALQRTHNNIELSMEWLLMNVDFDADEEEEEEEEEENAVQANSAERRDNDEGDEMIDEEEIMQQALTMSIEENRIDHITVIKKEALDWTLHMLECSPKLSFPCSDVLNLLSESNGSTGVLDILFSRLDAQYNKDMLLAEQHRRKIGPKLDIVMSLLRSISILIKHNAGLKKQMLSSDGMKQREKLLTILEDVFEALKSHPLDKKGSLEQIMINLLDILGTVTEHGKYDSADDVDMVEGQDLLEKFNNTMLGAQVDTCYMEKLLSLCLKSLDCVAMINTHIFRVLLPVLQNVTMSRELSTRAREMGCVEKILRLPWSLRFRHFTQQVTSVLQNLAEDEIALQIATENDVIKKMKSLAASHGRVTPKALMDACSIVFKKNPKIFFDSVMRVCTVPQRGEGYGVLELKSDTEIHDLRNKQVASDTVTEVLNDLLSAFMNWSENPTKFDHPKQILNDDDKQQKLSTKENEISDAKNRRPILERYHLLKICAEFVSLYNCADVIIQFTCDKLEGEMIEEEDIATSQSSESSTTMQKTDREDPETTTSKKRSPTQKQRSPFVRFLLREVVPYPYNPATWYSVHSYEKSCRFTASKMASYLLGMLCKHNCAATVFTELKLALANVINLPNPLRSIHAYSDYISSILSTRGQPYMRYREPVSTKTARALIQCDIVSAITQSLGCIDLNHPDTGQVTNSVLKSLEQLVKISGGFKNRRANSSTKENEVEDEIGYLDIELTSYTREFERMESDHRNFHGSLPHTSRYRYDDFDQEIHDSRVGASEIEPPFGYSEEENAMELIGHHDGESERNEVEELLEEVQDVVEHADEDGDEEMRSPPPIENEGLIDDIEDEEGDHQENDEVGDVEEDDIDDEDDDGEEEEEDDDDDDDDHFDRINQAQMFGAAIGDRHGFVDELGFADGLFNGEYSDEDYDHFISMDFMDPPGRVDSMWSSFLGQLLGRNYSSRTLMLRDERRFSGADYDPISITSSPIEAHRYIPARSFHAYSPLLPMSGMRFGDIAQLQFDRIGDSYALERPPPSFASRRADTRLAAQRTGYPRGLESLLLDTLRQQHHDMPREQQGHETEQSEGMSSHRTALESMLSAYFHELDQNQQGEDTEDSTIGQTQNRHEEEEQSQDDEIRVEETIPPETEQQIEGPINAQEEPQQQTSTEASTAVDVNLQHADEGEHPTDISVESGSQQPSTDDNAEQSMSSTDIAQDFGIDPTFLAALPDDLRHEVLAMHMPQLIGTAISDDGGSSINPAFLGALPQDIRDEVLQQERILRQREQQRPTESVTASTSQAASPPDTRESAPSDESDQMDPASFIASLTPDLRDEVLITMEDSVLAQLPPEMAAEAYALRNAYVLRQRRLRTSHRETGSSSSTDGRTNLNLDKTIKDEKGEPVMDTNDIRSLLRLLYLSSSGGKALIAKIFAQLCNNRSTRRVVIEQCMIILENHSSVEIQEKRKDSETQFGEGPSSNLHEIVMHKVHGIPSDVVFQLQEPTNHVPHIVLKRVAEILYMLCKENQRACHLFTRTYAEERNAEKSAIQKLSGSPAERLFKLISEPFIVNDSGVLQSIMRLLDVSLEYMNKLQLALVTEVNRNSEQLEQKKEELKKESKETSSEFESLQQSLEKMTNKRDRVAQSVRIIVTEEAIRRVVQTIINEKCTESTVKYAIKVIKTMANCMPESRKTILMELSELALREAKAVVEILENITKQTAGKPSRNIVQSSSAIAIPHGGSDAILATKLTKREQLFCRILKTYTIVLKAEQQKKHIETQQIVDNISSDSQPLEAPNQTEPHEPMPHDDVPRREFHLLKEWSLDFVWDMLHLYLKTISDQEENTAANISIHDSTRSPSQSQQQGVSSIVKLHLSRLLPLIEAYFLFHSGFTADDKEREPTVEGMESEATVSVSRMEATPLSMQPKPKVEIFIERNRKLLNNIVRSHPNLLIESLALMMKFPRLIDFDNKRTWFRSKLREDQERHAYGTLRLTVRREHIFVDSFYHLRHKDSDELKQRLDIKFQGEEGIDAGGLTKDWFLALSREMFNANYALFIQSADKSTFQPNPSSYINPEHIEYFKFIGRVIAMAIYNEQLLDCYFTRSFYKHIIGAPISFHDVESIDPDFYKSLRWMLENDITDVLENTFSAEVEEFGKRKVIELVPNGASIPVTNENKYDYVKKITELKMTTSIKSQIEAFLPSFYEIVPRELVSVFNEQELELLISGLPDVDIEDLQRNTEYYGYTESDPVIQWFWKAVYVMDRNERALLLQFATGTSQTPLDGFANLMGMSGVQRFNIHRVPVAEGRLPQSHTCFNQIDLPEYKTEEELKEKLKTAITECSGFGFA